MGLAWANPVAYDSLAVTRVSPTNATVRAASAAVQGAMSAPDSGLTPDTEYTYRFDGTRGTESCTATYTRRTLTPPTGGAYSLSCNGVQDGITVLWSGASPNQHTVRLYGGASTDPSLSQLATRTATLQGGTWSASDSFLDSPIPSGEEHKYRLDITFVDGSTTSTDTKTCSAPMGPDTPTNLNVTSLSPTSLWIDWTDNAYYVHDWELDRVRLTPDTPQGLSASNAGSGGATLSWTNGTNSLTDKGPFYHVYERSSNVGSPFGPGDTSIVSSTVEFPEDRVPTGAKTMYAATDLGLPSGTTFVYRVKACSYLTVDFLHHLPADIIVPDQVTCSQYSNTVSVTTPTAGLLPRARLAAASILSSVADALSKFFGFGISAEAQYAVKPPAAVTVDDYFTLHRRPLLFVNNQSGFRDTGLATSAAYLYRVRATYALPPQNYNRTISSWSNEAAGKTAYTAPSCFETSKTVRICLRNSYCGSTQGTEISCNGVIVNPLKDECGANSDCRHVGTSRKTFEEVK